ncbi:PucR family transcriptional regulator, partial [Nocardia sp. NPDC004722]
NRAALLGIDLRRPHVLVVVDHGDHRRMATWTTGYGISHHGLAATRGAHTVLLLPGADPAAIAGRIGRELTAALGSRATIAAAGPADLPAGTEAAYREAVRCVRVLHALGRTGTACSAANLGFVGLLISDDADTPGFLDDTLGPVVDYDARRRTELIHTLETYFATGCSLTASAKQLHVHVNTVTQRLDRITGLLGEGWQHPNRALEIQLALRLHRLRESAVFTA